MKTMKKAYLTWNIILLVLAMACLFYYDHRGGLALKGITSSWFVLLGLVNLSFARRTCFGNFRFMALTEAGLVLSMAADVLLGIDFMLGAAVFAAGHVFYFAAYWALEGFRAKDLIPIVLTGAISLTAVLGTPFIRVEEPAMKYLLAGYALAISFMLGKAIANFAAKRSTARLLILIGSAMFWFSDLMLALNLFGSGGRATSLLCMYTYWPGQYLLAHALYHFAAEERK